MFEEYFPYSVILNVIFGFLLLFIYLFAGDVCLTWIWAWLKKSPINIEWTKSKQYIFHIPTIDKAIPEVWEFDGGGRAIQVRREAIGIGPHKVPMMLTTSEFPAGVSPSEINGERYYIPKDVFYGIFFNGKVHKVEQLTEEEFKELNTIVTSLENPETINRDELISRKQYLESKAYSWNQRQLFVKYPEHGLNPSEFVSFQKVSPDPKLQAAHARRKDLLAKMNKYNAFNQISANAHWLIPFIVIAGIGFWFLQDHSQAVNASNTAIACEKHLAELYSTGQCVINVPANMTKNAVQLATGGGLSIAGK